MMTTLKHEGASGSFTCIAMLLAVIAVVATIVCSVMNSAYALNALSTILVMEIGGILFTLIGVYMKGRQGNTAIFSFVPVLFSIFVMIQAVGKLLSERILMIAGLFSYNAQNTAGWQVFYATAVAMVALVLSAVLLIIASFLHPKADA